jgi:hypothetical protein
MMNPTPALDLRAWRAARFAAGVAWAAAALAANAQTQPSSQAPPAAAAPAPSQQARYDAAHDQYEIGHFQLAFAAFAGLADEGHCESARIAQQMVRYGRTLYADEFVVTPARAAQWRALPSCPTALAAR